MSELTEYRSNQLKPVVLFLIASLLLVSCNTRKKYADVEMPALYPAPISVSLNTEEGYTYNPITGDTIIPIENSFGEKLITGIPVPGSGRRIDPNNFAKPLKFPVPKSGETLPGPVPEESLHPEIFTVNKDSLRIFTPGKDTSTYILVNSTGDTIPTGIQVPVKGVGRSFFYPQSQAALLPAIKENAVTNIRYLDIQQGMNGSMVIGMFEDSRGNLWFGTLSGGASMYDGNTFTHYTIKEGLKSNSIRCIFEDSQGNIWFGTQQKGLTKFDGHTFTHFTEEEGLAGSLINSIIEDSNGNLWFATVPGGVCKYDGETFTHFAREDGLGIWLGGPEDSNQNRTTKIFEDHLGRIWITTIGGGLCMYDGESFTNFSKEMTGIIIWSIFEDRNENLWTASNIGVSKYDGETFTLYSTEEGLSNNNAKSIVEDQDGNLWFSTWGGGVNKFDGRSFIHFTEEDGLNGNNVWTMLEDSQGNLWFSTIGGGVTVYQANSFQHYSKRDGLNIKAIDLIYESPMGALWVNGVCLLNEKTFVDYSDPDPAQHVLLDRNGNAWSNLHGPGICKFDGDSISLYFDSQGLPINYTRDMTEDSKGNIWITSELAGKGICMFDGVAFTHFTEKEGLSDNTVNEFLEDSKGNIWFATEGKGVSMFDGTSFTHYTEKEGLGNNYVRSLMEDHLGNMWFGTMLGGVSVFNGEEFIYFTEREGLNSNEIGSILEDREHHVWIGTQKGLNSVVLNPEYENSSRRFKNPVIHKFNQEDGLNGINFSQRPAILDSKNRIWWGTSTCLTMLDMNSFKLPEFPPSKLKFTRLDINGQFLDYRHLPDSIARNMEFDAVERFQNYPLNLKLPYRIKHLTFYFSAIDWDAPHKIRYSYLMSGTDKSWSNPSSEAKADYRNLSPGKHTLSVRAIGAAQKWSDSIEYTFKIRPPWWFSWWAYIIYGCILIAIIFQYRRFLLKRAKLQSAIEIERIEKEKVLELDHMKSRFFANISHEFRTPLTLILGPIEGLMNKKTRDIIIPREELGFIHRNAKRLQQLINQILDISILETGKVRLQVSEGNLEEYVRTIIFSFLSLAESKQINYKFDLPESDALVYFDSDKVEKILTNLLSNAFKFTPAEGEVRVTFVLHAQAGALPAHAEIIVEDSGVGMAPEKLERIFDRYYQGNDSDTGNAGGTGIGLALTRELVDLYRGEISVESEAGKGTIFKVMIPVGKTAFKEEEMIASTAAEEIKPGITDHIVEPADTNESDSSDRVLEETGGGKPIVLIVEDNIDLRNYISRNLGDEYEIHTAENGSLGLNTAIENIPDLVISDVMMPVMDGVEMCRQLKADARTNHIPVIMLTAKADRESKMEGLETGADDYIIKPFDAEELQVRVRNLIEQRERLREKFRKEFANLSTNEQEVLPEDPVLKSVLGIFEKNIDNPDFTVDDVGKELHMSRAQIYRKISAVSGSTPLELLRMLRMNKAAVLLRTTDNNVTQVMYEVGFRSTSHFAQSFKHFFGVNPSEFKKQKE
ncbi:two-component regulator propeller domain-containing protein [Bacteroidota bacterium]